MFQDLVVKGDRKGEGEGGAFVDFRIYSDFAAHHFDVLFGDVETEAGAFVFGHGPPAFTLRVSSVTKVLVDRSAR